MTAAPALPKPWVELTSTEKEAAVEPLWRDGKSASQIVTYVGAPSRNSVITVCGRLRKRNGIKPMNRAEAATLGWFGRRAKAEAASTETAKPKQKLHAGNIARKKASREFDPGLPPPSPFPVKLECRAVPLLGLRKDECRWAVNDAALGEDHLFCGLPATNRSYCRHHWLRSIGAGTESERSAHRSLERVAA